MAVLLYISIGLALVFGFFNAFHDSSNIVATIITSRALSPRKALLLTAAAEVIGPFLFGQAVAATIGKGLVPSGSITIAVILAALLSATLWSIFTWLTGIPSSSSHALIGGLTGGVIAAGDMAFIEWGGFIKVILALFLSPLIGLLIAYLFTKLVLFLARNASMRINRFFKSAQIVTGLGLALTHASNDAQKTIAMITLSLLLTGQIASFQVPIWVIVASGGIMALGTSIGGWRLIKTIGAKFYRIRPVHGFCAQVSSAAVILTAALLGGPVSTTQVISSAVLGAGSAQRVNMVRWGVAGQIVIAWLLTIPVTAGMAALLVRILASLIKINM